jgi:hypothetical protein
MPPEWMYPVIRLQGITTQMISTSKYTTTKNVLQFLCFQLAKKSVYDSRYMFGSPLNLITHIILIYIVPCILLQFQRFITYS